MVLAQQEEDTIHTHEVVRRADNPVGWERILAGLLVELLYGLPTGKQEPEKNREKTHPEVSGESCSRLPFIQASMQRLEQAI